MYYDRQTQQKYIRRFILSICMIVVLIISAIIIYHFADSSSGTSGNQPIPESIGTTKEDENNEPVEQEPVTKTLYKVISVTDGDTIRIDYNGTSTPVRIIGIDSRETVDPRTDVECFGPEATRYLTNLLEGKSVSIEADPTQDDLDKYDRLLRYIYLDGEDVGLKMIEGGYASEYTYNLPYKYQSVYKATEALAKQNKKGQWADGICENKETSTTVQSKVQESQTTTVQQCLIKGNINNKGEKIYHMPGQQYYNDTVISTNKGERWFCTEQEAISAGWRKAKV